MLEDLQLIVNGVKHSGWKSARILRSIEAICGAFELTVTDAWTIGGKPRALAPEMPCKVLVGDSVLIDGAIDAVSVTGSYGNHEITIKGRDKTADLVDCSVIKVDAEMYSVTLFYIIDKIAYPYGIRIAHESLGRSEGFEKWSTQPCEKCFEAIDRACRAKGFFPTVNFNGEIVIAQAGTNKISKPLAYGTSILSGQSIKAFSGNFTIENRYKDYYILAQTFGIDESDAESNVHVTASATDPGVSRNRSLKTMAEKAMNRKEAKARVQWEAAVRAGRAGELSVTVQGWRDGEGNIWDHNKLIDVYLPYVFGDEKYHEMLIISTSMSLDDKSGSITELKLRRKDSALPEPLKPKKTEFDIATAVRINAG